MRQRIVTGTIWRRKKGEEGGGAGERGGTRKAGREGKDGRGGGKTEVKRKERKEEWVSKELLSICV